MPLCDQIDAFLDQGEHAERQEVDLDESGVVTGVLVPLTQEAAFPRCRFDRDDLHERSARDDHAPDVLGNVTGQAGDVFGEIAEQLPQVPVGPILEFGQRCDLICQPGCGASLGKLGELLEFTEWQVQGLANLANCRLQAIRRESTYESRMFMPVIFIHA